MLRARYFDFLLKDQEGNNHGHKTLGNVAATITFGIDSGIPMLDRCKELMFA
jgi:hypothetical protein